MLMPNRHGSTDDYRYGFQGQEKDDEIKGEGNSLNYTFRMHDPRIGRFGAVDPLSPQYPELTPYQFSGNRPIDHVEVEGLEGSDVDIWLQDNHEHKLKTLKGKELQEYIDTRGAITVGIGAVWLELFFTKGKASQFLLGQYSTQVGVNATTSFIIDGKVNWSVFEDSFNDFDFGDAGIDKGFDLVLDRYKIGKLKDALKISASAFFDITKENGVEVMSWSEDSDKIIGDIVANVLLEGIDEIAGENIDLPITKLNKNTVDAVTQYIKESLVNTVIEGADKIVEKNQRNKPKGTGIKTKNNAVKLWFDNMMKDLEKKINNAIDKKDDN